MMSSQQIKPSSLFLGHTEHGDVVKTGPYGDSNSDYKVAYITGVHPQETASHNALLEILEKYHDNLKKQYYIYQINVSKDAEDYKKGRNNGQTLAYEYAIPDIKEKYHLALDIHSNRGNWDETLFIFVPHEDERSNVIAQELVNNISWMIYYYPPNPTSPNDVTVPLIKSGVPSIIYETYAYESYQTTLKHAEDLVLTVDKMNL
jgi:hypothetical protein